MRDTIEMAREAGIYNDDAWRFGMKAHKDSLEVFAALIRADERNEAGKWFDAVTAQHKQEILAEREACAKVCEEFDTSVLVLVPTTGQQHVLAAAIRARGSK
jgi:hypothetical protein